MKKVLLISPANTIPTDSIRRLSTPLGLMYMAAVLEKDYNVKIIDSACEGYYNHTTDGDYLTYGLSDQDLKKQIADFSPDVIGVSCMFSAMEKNSLHVCGLAKEVCPDVPVILGGIHPSLFPEKMLESGVVDCVIKGEGEFKFKELLENGIERIAVAPKIENLDSIPYPARHLIDMEKYIKIGVPYAPFAKEERVEGILTSRGCPFNCWFCSTTHYWGGLRLRSVENIIGEVRELVDKYGIQEIQFADDNMTADKEHARELFTRLKDFKLSWCTPHGLMMGTLDREMIKLMAESGAYQITVAIESGSQRVLKEVIHKPVPEISKVKELVKVAQDCGIQVHALFVTGFPGETKEEIMMTMDYPFRVGFDSVSFFLVNPLPGSELYGYCKEKGYLPENIDFSKMDFKNAGNLKIPKNSPDYAIDPQELQELVDKKTREYNEFSKSRFPNRWDSKFKTFLKRHPNDADVILGRVT